ncbi:MAG: extracellular solute-binding protein [Chthonomonas sp.]|nr:extracellular solute-binding protein [Chthonomonas sp.]
MRTWLLGLAACFAAAIAVAQPVQVRMMAGPSMGIPPKEDTNPRSQARRAVFDDFRAKNPDIEVVNAGGLEMVGDRAESMFLMSMAGDNAPDVFYVNFRQYYNYIDQGFCRPLDDLVAKNPEILDRANPKVLEVLRSYDGKLYGVPWFQVAQGLYYRRDHFAQAGLDPNRPPRTWEEFNEVCRRLVQADQGRFGFGFAGPSYFWVNFLWQAGGEVVVPAEEGRWKSAIDSPQAAQALDFFRTVTTQKWQHNGKTIGPAATVTADLNGDIRTGKISMWFAYTNDVVVASMNDLSPSLVGVAALPAGPAGRANEINAGMWAINARIKDPRKLEACWRFIRYFAGDHAARINTERFVELGLANLINPVWLKKFGYPELAAQVDPAYVKASEDLFKSGHPEPYGRNCQQVYRVLDSALDRARLEPNTPSREILAGVSQEMDKVLLGYVEPKVLAHRRAVALGVLIGLSIALIGGFIWGARRVRPVRDKWVEKLPAGTSPRRVRAFMAWCLLPAVGTIMLWAYYPIARGLLIAFQDYRIAKGVRWVGLDNFVQVFSQPLFYKSLGNTFLYVALTIVIGFFVPIFLALMLNEIPRFKVFFRTLFYLPAMTSSVVVALLWRQLYDKTDKGILNIFTRPFFDLYGRATGQTIGPVDWLGDPKWAMLAIVIPGIWAAAGPGSMLYLAALKNIPEERYEAADLDGASWRHKLRFITLPGLRALMLINLLGVFVAGFKSMESVLLLTGGGPLYSTHTIGYEIWSQAFMFLNFGYATAAAWIMGIILVGFTLVQIRSLLRMRFSTAGR